MGLRTWRWVDEACRAHLQAMHCRSLFSARWCCSHGFSARSVKASDTRLPHIRGLLAQRLAWAKSTAVYFEGQHLRSQPGREGYEAPSQRHTQCRHYFEQTNSILHIHTPPNTHTHPQRPTKNQHTIKTKLPPRQLSADRCPACPQNLPQRGCRPHPRPRRPPPRAESGKTGPPGASKTAARPRCRCRTAS